jgi:hypothetical protein
VTRLGNLFPWPLVGVALLLVTLIVFTPILITNSESPFLTQAVLVVDRVSGPGATTNFYVHATGGTVRYQSISMAVSYGFNWTGGFPSGNLTWTDWQNRSSAIAYAFFCPYNPVVVAVTATYTSGSTNITYAGLIAFYVGSVGTNHEVLYAVTGATTSAVSVPSSIAVSQLPLPIQLEVYTGRGIP